MFEGAAVLHLHSLHSALSRQMACYICTPCP